MEIFCWLFSVFEILMAALIEFNVYDCINNQFLSFYVLKFFGFVLK